MQLQNEYHLDLSEGLESALQALQHEQDTYGFVVLRVLPVDDGAPAICAIGEVLDGVIIGSGGSRDPSSQKTVVTGKSDYAEWLSHLSAAEKTDPAKIEDLPSALYYRVRAE